MRLICLLAGALAACAADSPFETVTTATVQFRQAAISPDGREIAFVQGLRDPDSRNSLLFVGSPGTKPRQITAGTGGAVCQEKDPAWSPDGKSLAFLSDCRSRKQLQLFVADRSGANVRKLTTLKGYLQVPKWSPRGKEIAVLFTENAVRAAGATEAAAKDAGVVEEVIHEQRLTLIDAASGAPRILSPADTYVYEYSWSPDSSHLTYTAAKGAGDNNWWVAQLYSISADSGETRHLLKPDMQIADPRWSKDGKQIAFIQGLMSDEGSTGGDIYAIPAAGGNPRNLTPDISGSPSSIEWLPGGGILFSEVVDGSTAIATLDPNSGQTEVLWKGDESLRAGGETVSISEDGKSVATIRNSFTAAPEVWAGPINDWKPVTNANAALKPVWGKSEKLHWMSEGKRIDGWLVYPLNFQPGRKYGMIVSVHGGPSAAKRPSWPMTGFDLNALSAEGFFVLYPNPRGSFGGGEAFARGNIKDFGYGDLRDILAGVNQAVHDYPIDEERLGIGGWSYGGYMTMWTVTQTHRFKAAVAGAGIANWQSYYGQNLIDQWMIPFFGASVYDDPAIYARSSPITFIKNVRTPTLVLVGDSDEECPSPQSYEFWHALKSEGVKTRLVIYPGEGHHFRKPENQKDLVARTIAWFKENLPAGPSNTPETTPRP
jgi:dipeptidyl aminopeptidase/acylaminoacyl peptidase